MRLPSEVRLRAGRSDAADELFLWRMLVEAASWRSDRRKLKVSDAVADPSLARYVHGWGRRGDRGVIAETVDAPVGRPGSDSSPMWSVATASSTPRSPRCRWLWSKVCAGVGWVPLCWKRWSNAHAERVYPHWSATRGRCGVTLPSPNSNQAGTATPTHCCR
jgi:hypothetical protein